MSHWAEVYIAADKYQFVTEVEKAKDLKKWASMILICHIHTAARRLLLQHNLPSNTKISAADQAVLKQTDFGDLVRAVDIFLGSTLADDAIQYCLREIEWGIFAANNDHAAWVNLISKYPGYAAEVMARQSEDVWENFHMRQKREAELIAAETKRISAAAN